MIQPQIKDYQLSTDYKKLFDLIHQGYRIAAWVTVPAKLSDISIINLVEVKLMRFKQKYSIGTAGISYDSFDSTFEQFEIDCKKYSLKYIDPTKP
jgi:hypothetical protein